jgi:hypothetical protein
LIGHSQQHQRSPLGLTFAKSGNNPDRDNDRRDADPMIRDCTHSLPMI